VIAGSTYIDDTPVVRRKIWPTGPSTLPTRASALPPPRSLAL